MATTRALIYVRISSDRAGAGLGVGRQEKDCRALAKRLGWDVIDVLVDNDVSAYSGKPRLAYRTLLQRLADGHADALLAWHTDRLHRSPAELEEFIDVVEKASVQIQTVTAGPLDLASPSGRMVARMLGATARYEVEQTSARQRRKRLEKVAAGEFVGGRRPFGYEADGMTLVPREAEAVATATREVVEGRSVRSIAHEWNREGVVTSAGNRWEPTEVRRTLMRPRNAGLSEHRGEVVGRAKWPPLVDEDLWRACVAILFDPSRRTVPGRGRSWLGSGLYLCGVCGATVKIATTKKGQADYRCADSYHMMRRAVLVDELVEAATIERMGRPDVADLAVRETPDLSGWHHEASLLRTQLDDMARLFADGVLTASQLAAGTGRLRARLEQVQGQVADAGRVNMLARFAGQNPADVWGLLDLDARRTVVEQLWTVTLHPGRKGRPVGWQPGEPYFDPRSVVIAPR